MTTLIIIGIILLCGLILLIILLSYGNKYMASPQVKIMPLPGDDLLKDKEKILTFTKEVMIEAPADKVWEYLAQQGQTKAGFYSFVLLERLFTFKIKNTYHIVPEWTNIKPGEWMFYHQMGIGSEIIGVEKGKYITTLSDTRKPPVDKGKAFALRAIPGGQFAWTWSFITQPVTEHKTRLIQRCHNYFKPNNFIINGLIRFFLGIPSIVMTTRQMTVLKLCAEGKYPK